MVEANARRISDSVNAIMQEGLPNADQIELFFWEVFAVSSPMLSTGMMQNSLDYSNQSDSTRDTIAHGGGVRKIPPSTIHFYEVSDHKWLHETSRRIQGRWIIRPITFQAGGNAARDKVGSSLYGDFSGSFHEGWGRFTFEGEVRDSEPVVTLQSTTSWPSMIESSMEYPLLLKVTGRVSPIEIWCYQGLFMITEHDKWMFMTTEALYQFIKIGMMDGKYLGMYVLPNSAFVNFNLIKLSKTPLQSMNTNLMREKLDKKYA